jgi:hypothetical protein
MALRKGDTILNTSVRAIPHGDERYAVTQSCSAIA